MPNLSIKDVPEAWAEVLRQQAAKHHRSLQGELMSVIEAAVHQALRDADAVPATAGRASTDKTQARIVGYDKRGWPIVRQGWKTPEELFAEMRAAGAKPVPGQPLGVDIIRRDRDSR